MCINGYLNFIDIRFYLVSITLENIMKDNDYNNENEIKRKLFLSPALFYWNLNKLEKAHLCYSENDHSMLSTTSATIIKNSPTSHVL